MGYLYWPPIYFNYLYYSRARESNDTAECNEQFENLKKEIAAGNINKCVVADDDTHLTVLLMAMRDNDYDMVKFFIENGAKLECDMYDYSGESSEIRILDFAQTYCGPAIINLIELRLAAPKICEIFTYFV